MERGQLPYYFCNSVNIYLETGGEFHHLIGLDVVQTVDTGDTITNAQHTASFFQISLRGCAQNAFFQNLRDFCSTLGA